MNMVFFVSQMSSSWGVTQAGRTYVGVVVVVTEHFCVFNRMNIGYNISYKVLWMLESNPLQKMYSTQYLEEWSLYSTH